MLRTAGFNSLDVGDLQPLMFIGASGAGTGIARRIQDTTFGAPPQRRYQGVDLGTFEHRLAQDRVPPRNETDYAIAAAFAWA